MITQFDLFGDVERAETERLTSGLACLRDSVPVALEVVVHLNYWRPRDDRGVGACGAWAYAIRASGVCFEPAEEWWTGARNRGEPYGWSRTPAHRLGWDELADLLRADSRRRRVVEWANSLTAPDHWRDLSRPHELWPDPGIWHPSYIEGDHERPGWRQRLAAWHEICEILTDAIAQLSPPITGSQTGIRS